MIIDYNWTTDMYKKAFPFLGQNHKMDMVGRDWNFIDTTR